MSCVKCGLDTSDVFHTEVYPCSCGESTVIEYNLCNKCGSFWRTVNSNLIEESLTDSDFLFGDGKDIVMGLMDDLNSLIKPEKTRDFSSMEECIDRCLRCNAISYEIAKGVFRCSECDTEWEIIASE